ncbi:hypothetical protein BV344_05597 [Pseudomonas syringae pv. actinidiae]|nr:hypothetical protein BV344_05597 [Pseudomonas syringae pv. actinidiae]
MGIERIVLENHRDVARLGGDIVHADAVNHQFTGADLLQSGDHAQRRRFTAARWPDEDDELLVLNFEVEILHHVDLVIVDFLNVF